MKNKYRFSCFMHLQLTDNMKKVHYPIEFSSYRKMLKFVFISNIKTEN